MPKPHYYASLDSNHPVLVELPMRRLAELVNAENFGVHRFLSHLIDVRREERKKRLKHYEDIGASDVAESVRRIGDELTDGLEALLNQDLT